MEEEQGEKFVEVLPGYKFIGNFIIYMNRINLIGSTYEYHSHLDK